MSAHMPTAASGEGAAVARSGVQTSPPTGNQLDIFAEADARKQRGMAQVDANADDMWKATADQAIRHLADTGRTFEAYDLVLLGVPEPHHPNAWGARLSAAAKHGVITNVGAGPSKRPTVAKSLVRYWRGAA